MGWGDRLDISVVDVRDWGGQYDLSSHAILRRYFCSHTRLPTAVVMSVLMLFLSSFCSAQQEKIASSERLMKRMNVRVFQHTSMHTYEGISTHKHAHIRNSLEAVLGS